MESEHGARDRLAGEHLVAALCRAEGGAAFGFLGAAAAVRRHNDVFHAEEGTCRVSRLRLRGVETRAGDLSGAQRLDQRRLIDQTAAGGVDQAGGLFHAREFTRADAVLVFRCGRHVQGDKIGVVKDLVAVRHQSDIRKEKPSLADV